MKIVIAGAGEVGSHLARMLSREANDLTIIDKDEEHLNKLEEIADIVTVQGSPTSIATLREADVQKADLFIAVSPAQEQDVNIVSAMLAKKLGARKVTARINNDEYLKTDNKQLFTDMGIDSLFYPEKMAAYEIIDLLKQTGTTEFMKFSGGILELAVFKMDESNSLINKTIRDLSPNGSYKPYQAVAITRNNITIIPKKDTKFLMDDLVYFICTKDGFSQLMTLFGKSNIDIRNLMIIGGGRVGEMLARKMQDSVSQIKIIEHKKDRCEYLAETLPNTVVINGDGRNTDLLMEEDAKNYDAFVAVTSSSETNILSCVAVKKMGVPKTIAEIENIEYIKLAEDMGVDAVINKKLTTAGRIFKYTLSTKVHSIKCLNGSDANVLEFMVDPNSAITAGPIKDLRLPKEAIIGGIVRKGEGFIANDYTTIEPFDKVVIFALPQALKTVNKFFV